MIAKNIICDTKNHKDCLITFVSDKEILDENRLLTQLNNKDFNGDCVKHLLKTRDWFSFMVFPKIEKGEYFNFRISQSETFDTKGE